MANLPIVSPRIDANATSGGIVFASVEAPANQSINVGATVMVKGTSGSNPVRVEVVRGTSSGGSSTSLTPAKLVGAHPETPQTVIRSWSSAPTVTGTVVEVMSVPTQNEGRTQAHQLRGGERLFFRLQCDTDPTPCQSTINVLE